MITVQGQSMEPTLHHGQRLVARRVAPSHAARLVRGDIAVFLLSGDQLGGSAEGDPTLRVKRIAAVAGDPVPESLRSEPWAGAATHVPPGKIIVLGDNPVSQGSRELGYIDAKAVVAVVGDGATRSRPLAASP